MISVRHSLRNKQAKSKSTIRTSITYAGNRITFCAGYSISPENWDYLKGVPRSIKGDVNVKITSNNLKELDLKISRLYDDLSSNGREIVPPVLFKKRVLEIVKPSRIESEAHRFLLIEFMNIFITDCEVGKRLKENKCRMEKSSIKPYRTTRMHIQKFQKIVNKNFDLADFSQQFHDEFSDYLVEDLGLARNSHSKYIMALNQVIKYAVDKKLLPPSILMEIKFSTQREETDSIYLKEEDLQFLIDMQDFKNKGEEIVRDIFIIGCYTGMRFSNYSQVDLSHIRGGFLHAIQHKTKEKVTIPIHEHVQAIIDKYNGKLPPSPTNQEFNRTLKELGARIPVLNVPFEKQITRGRKKQVEKKMKWEMLMTHTARRSFCTNQYLREIPVMTIMAISGHRSEKSFRRYIRATQDEHAAIMKKHWDKSLIKNG